jgi:hypothetical protein
LFDEFFDAAASNPDFDILDLFEQNSDDTIKSYFSNLQHFTEVVELMAAPKPPYDVRSVVLLLISHQALIVVL